jgi:hypothetical protein
VKQTFVFLVRARAALGHERFPEGEWHEALMFVVDDDMDTARSRGVAELTLARWSDIQVKNENVAREDDVEEPEEAIRAARKDAREHGLGIVIWTPPEGRGGAA